MTEPPSDAGTDHDTAAEASPLAADTPVGAPGVVIGVTAVDAPEATEVPTELVAVTVNVYEVPLTKPVTVHDSAAVVEQVLPPGDDVTV